MPPRWRSAGCSASSLPAARGCLDWESGWGPVSRPLIVPEAPLSPEHIAKYGAGQPLPLPFGLTGSPVAQWLAGSLLIMAFPFIGAYVGWMLRKIAERLTA